MSYSALFNGSLGLGGASCGNVYNGFLVRGYWLTLSVRNMAVLGVDTVLLSIAFQSSVSAWICSQPEGPFLFLYPLPIPILLTVRLGV
jgi:hypothetical protein